MLVSRHLGKPHGGLIALHGRVAALCADPARDPAEVAAGLAAALREALGYDAARVAFGAGPDGLAEVPGTIVVPIAPSSGTIAATPPPGDDPLAPDDHRALLAAVAAQAGGYLARRAERAEAARLRAEDARRVQELAAMNEVALATASLDLDRVLAELLPRTLALLRADYCTLVLRDAAGDGLAIRAAAGAGAERLVGLALPADRSFSHQLIAARAPRRWDPADAASVAPVFDLLRPGTLPSAAIGAPLLVQDRAIGTIVAANARPEEFSDADLRFLMTVAAQAAVAVENARLHADTLRLARYDALTGLANRRYFLEVLDRAVETAARYGRPLALLIIDLDHFKTVNDTFGHLAGDTLLRAVAERLAERLRRSDFPARYAGDELAVILPETGLPGALALAERLRAAVADEPLPTGEALPAWLTLSIGVAAYAPGAAVGDFLRAADSALYFAKHEGRNRVRGPEAAEAALRGPADDLATILGGGNQAVIEELAAAVDARVPESAGRAARAAAVAVALGAALGLPPGDLDALRGAALVRDIGEVSINPALLGRPGPLDPAEWALVRAHPRRSYDLLAAVPAFREALPAVLHHHERWDGTGYPDGLRGEAIPRDARIIAVADAWVALTTDRPHRPALPHAAALAEIARHAGTQFDPAVVGALASASAAL